MGINPPQIPGEGLGSATVLPRGPHPGSQPGSGLLGRGFGAHQSPGPPVIPYPHIQSRSRVMILPLIRVPQRSQWGDGSPQNPKNQELLSHFPLLPPHSPRASCASQALPKICWVRLCPDPSIRTEHKGETGVAAAPNTGDVPHLELLEMPHTTAGGGPSSQGRVRLGHLPPVSWESFPSSSRSTDPCHPTLPPQWGQHLQTP